MYMDDVIASSSTWEAHLILLEDMFQGLQAAGLTLKPSEIHLGSKEVPYLGHILSADGIRIVGEDRIRSIVDLKTPTFFSSFFFSLISLIADGPHHYHPACGHKGSSHLSPVHALQFFIAMQVQHSYNSSTNVKKLRSVCF